MLIDKETPFYTVVQVAELLGMSSDRLRTYDEEGLVMPHRAKNNKRLYSELDIEWIKDIRYLISKDRMNIFSFKLLLDFMQNINQKEVEKYLKTKDKNHGEEVYKTLKKLIQNPNFQKLKK